LQNSWSPPRLFEKKNRISSESNTVLFYDNKTERLWLFYLTMGKLVNGHLGGWSSCRMKCNHSTDLNETGSESRYLHNVWGWKIRNKHVRMSNRNIILPIYIEMFFYKSTFLACPKKIVRKRC